MGNDYGPIRAEKGTHPCKRTMRAAKKRLQYLLHDAAGPPAQIDESEARRWFARIGERKWTGE